MLVSTTPRRHSSGFTLLEIAIALSVLAFLSIGLVTALRVQQARNSFSDAKIAQHNARDAVLMFATTQGRLPCPAKLQPAAVADQEKSSDGVEDCSLTTGYGAIPWKTLALDAKGIDYWGKELRYTVSSNFQSTGFKLDAPGNIYVINQSNKELVNHEAVAFVIWSIGADAINASSATQLNSRKVVAEADCTPASTPQGGQSDIGAIEGGAAAPNCEVDDIVSWTSRYVLLARLRETGWLPESSQSSSAAASSAP